MSGAFSWALSLPCSLLPAPSDKGQHTKYDCACLQVTFFWNGNRSGYFKEELETYVEIPSDAVPFNEKPDMKAREITEAGKEALLSGKYDMVRVNFANPGACACCTALSLLPEWLQANL